MNPLATTGLLLLAAYLLGAVPFGYLVARARGVDIFRHGSGNIGATNVGRILGRRFGLLVFLLDFAKGAVPTAVAYLVTGEPNSPQQDFPPPTALTLQEFLPVGAGLAAFLGHCYSVYLRFRGGKGVATAAGVVAVLLPGPALAAVLVWLAVLCASRYMSLAVLTGAVVLCLLRLATSADPFGPDQRVTTVFCLVAAGLVFVRHRANIGRLFRGTENRLQESPALLTFAKALHLLALGLFGPITLAPCLFCALVVVNEFFMYPLVIKPDLQVFLAVQATWGLVAVITALSWTNWQPDRDLHKARATRLVVALLTALACWPLAVAARGHELGGWQLVCFLCLELLTQLLVIAALVLAGRLPAAAPFFGTSAQPPSSKQAEGAEGNGGKLPHSEMES
jgi:acyl-phosphate glycerol 3-phosphate acyltransferase